MPSLPWHAIDTVLLDMDGTLLDLHYDNHFWMEHLPQRYAELHGVSQAMAEIDWSLHSTQRVADARSLNGRDRLAEAIRAQGFPIR